MIEAVEIRADDGTTLRGELRRGSDVWVVLAHDVGSDLDVWRPICRALVAQGQTVLAVDLRGHGGSDGEADDERAAQDLGAVIDYAREMGAEGVVVGAAGAAVGSALEAATAAIASGFLAIAPRGHSFEQGPPAKLVVLGASDGEQVAAGRALQRTAGSTLVVSLPLADDCAGMLSGPWGPNVRDYVCSFVREAAGRAAGAPR